MGENLGVRVNGDGVGDAIEGQTRVSTGPPHGGNHEYGAVGFTDTLDVGHRDVEASVQPIHDRLHLPPPVPGRLALVDPEVET